MTTTDENSKGEQPVAGLSEDTTATNVQGMSVLERSVYRGPHLFSHIPMVRIQVHLGVLEAHPTDSLPGFADALLGLLPGLDQHGCCYRTPGGFIKRLREGTWLGHVAEHVAIELQSAIGAKVSRGKTRSVKGKPGTYNVMFQYRDEEVGLLAGRLALQLVESLLPAHLRGIKGLNMIFRGAELNGISDAFNIDAALDALRRVHRRVGLGPSTRALADEASRRGIPVARLDKYSLLQLGHGRRQKRLRAAITSGTSHLAVEVAGDKSLTKELLAAAGIPVPNGEIVRDAEQAVRAAETLGYPVVTKPLDGNHGRGVNVDLDTPERVRWGFEQAAAQGRRIIVERYFRGKDYRALVVGGEVVAIAERQPPQVVGDGVRNVAQLVAGINQDPRRGKGHEAVMTRIELDSHVDLVLADQGLTRDSIIEKDRAVKLRTVANLSQGGSAIDRTDEAHPENLAILRRAALTVGLDVAGVDFIAPDIARSVMQTGGGVVEINASPGLRMHLEPAAGRPRNVARPILDILFPRETPARIPIFAITGTNGKSTTTRMLAHILRHAGRRVGLTTTSGVYIDDEVLGKWDASGPGSARMILRDPTVDVAVLETARGGILREGLAFDRCDVGVVLNVQEDHIGLKGVDTLDDLAAVKSVVVESVHPQGHSVLNADDPRTVAMRRHAAGRISFFSLRGGREMPAFLKAHVAAGGLAVVREHAPGGDRIVLHEDRKPIPLMRTSEIPACLGGLAEFNVQNAMAAAAMAFAHGLSSRTISEALATFSSSFEQSPGRLNIYDGHGFRVILDYAHNPAGLRALGKVLRGLRPQYRRMIGMVNIPGDRRDDDMREMGRIGASIFDDIVLREDPARRGRKPGEIVGLLAEGALSTGFSQSHIHMVLEEHGAAEVCLKLARPGDLVVLTPTSVESMWQQTLDFRPTFEETALPPSGPRGILGAA